MKCKWYQEEAKYLGQGSCSNPVAMNSKLERRKTGKQYPDVSNPVNCTRCQINSFFALPIILAVVIVPLYYGLKSI